MNDTIESFFPLIQKLVQADYEKNGNEFNIKHVVDFQDGQKVIKMISHSDGWNGPDSEGQRSVYGFIVKADNTIKCDKGGYFKRGDFLKAASWKAYTKNFSRGNVFDLTDASHLNWTSII